MGERVGRWEKEWEGGGRVEMRGESGAGNMGTLGRAGEW